MGIFERLFGRCDQQTLMEALAHVQSTILLEVKFQGARFMATMQDVLNDLVQIKQKTGDYIAGRDAIDVDLRAQLAAALANAGISAAEQADIDAAFDKAEAEKALLTPPVAPPSPQPATLLVDSYTDRASFDAAVMSDPNSQEVTLDGTPVRAGPPPSFAYFSHSGTGEINKTGPTD